MFRVVLTCDGVPVQAGPQAAIDITGEFATHRPWHQNVTCRWDSLNKCLVLQADNDFDNNGLALMDEFSDAITAYIKDAGDGEIRVVSAIKLP
jgi:hypothetical protein